MQVMVVDGIRQEVMVPLLVTVPSISLYMARNWFPSILVESVHEPAIPP